jgi:putative ABC transport system permease protein
MDGIPQEIRYAARRLVRTPVFTLTAIATLALAIGANASIFAVVQRVLLNPLPYPDSDRLIEIDHGAAGLNMASGLGTTSGLYFHYADRSRTLERLALYRTEDATLTGGGDPLRIRIARATPSLASVLRVAPAIGRWFTGEEGEPGRAAVAVLAHGLWVRRYNADPQIVGRSVTLDGQSAEIVGIMPASFTFPDPRVDMWVAEPVTRTTGFGLWSYQGVARVRDGASFEQARAESNGLIPDVAKAYPGDPRAAGNLQSGLSFSGRSLKEATTGGIARALWILLGSVVVVLLVACANVANLFVARSEARQRDVAVRRALGATRAGIARYFLAESLLMSIAGGAIGLFLARIAVRLLVAYGPATLPRLHEIRLDGVTVGFTAVLSLVAAIAFGAIPIWHGAAIAGPIHEMGRSNTASLRRHRARHLLMAAQVALALVLLVSSGLMVRSFQNLRAVDPGFSAASALTFSVGLPPREYRTRDALVAGHHQILDRLAALPGVTAASASSCLPLNGSCFGNTVRVEGRTYPRGTTPPIALFRAVAGGYFETMGMRLLRGRTIARGDIERREPVVVVSETLAKRLFPGQDAIGQRLVSNRAPRERPLTWLTIVGVVSDTPVRTLAEANPLPQLFMPMSIAGGADIPLSALIGPDISVMTFVVRSAAAPAALTPAVRRAVDAVDPNLALAQVRTLQDMLDAASAQMAFTMVLLAIAATVALVLGVIGVFGVVSYIVSQRTAEIGVRLALGAEPRSVAGMIARQGGRVALAGVAAGLAIALAGSRVIASLLYGVSARDPAVFAASALVLTAVALLACWLPARRATRVDVMAALRQE